MEHPEITPEHIRDFLKGRLSADEADTFRQRMADDLALEEEVAFARLLSNGLEEIAQRDGRRQTSRVKKWVFTTIIAFALLLIAYFIWKSIPPQPPKEKPYPPPPPIVGVSIAWTKGGEVIMGGQYQGRRELGTFTIDSFGKQDFFVAKCNASGQILWPKAFGSARGNDYLTKIALDKKDNIIITGGLFDSAFVGDSLVRAVGKANGGEGDFFVAKLDSFGKVLWLKHSGGIMAPHKQTGNNMGTAVTVDKDNNVIATGMYIGSPKLGHVPLPVGGPNEDLYLAKYDPGGKLMWATAATCDYNIYANSVTTDPKGNIYLSGFFGHHNLSGKAHFGDITLQSYGGRDIFVAKYDPNGKLLWVRQSGSPNLNSQDYGKGIVADDSSCVMTGWFEGTPAFAADTTEKHRGNRDIFLAKYDSAGKLIWVKTMGGKQNDQGNALCLDDEGNIYCAGHFTGEATIGDSILTSRGDNDIFIVKYNKNGIFQWAKQTGSPGADWQMDSPHDLSFGPNGWLVLTGMFSGQELYFGEKVIVKKGEKGVFLIFFDKNGNFQKAEILPV